MRPVLRKELGGFHFRRLQPTGIFVGQESLFLPWLLQIASTIVAMGLYDRDYGRSSEPGLQLSRPQTITMQLVVLTGCVYLAQMIFGPTGWVNQNLALDTLWYKKPWQFYQFLSYGFLHSLQAVQHILFNMYGLWLFGRDIEQRYGRQEFLSFYLSAIVIAGLVWNLSTLLSGDAGGGLIGASGGVVAVTILFALNFPHRKLLLMFLFPIPMWVLGCIIVLSDIFGALDNSDISNVAFMAHLGGAAFAILYYRFRWNPGRWLFDKYSSLSSAQLRSRSKLKIHAPDDEQDVSKSDEQVDEILKKIQAEGQDSLTRRERRILEKASQEYQRKRR